MIQAVQIFCGCCGTIFGICRQCYRNQRYCNDQCRIAGYQQNHREAQCRYMKKDIGKKQHSEAEKRRRKRKKEGAKKKESILTKTCMCLSMLIKSLFLNYNPFKKKGNCILCGKDFDINEICIEVIEPGYT